MKKVLLLLFLVAGTAMAQTGFVNYQTILYSMPEAEPIRKELDALSEKLKADLDKAKANYEQKVQELQYQAQKPGTTDAQKQQFEQQYMMLQSEIQKTAQDAESNLQTRESDLMKPIILKLNEAIEAVAKEKGLKLVVNATQVVYSEPGASISIEVAQRLGIKIDAEGKPTGN